MTSSGSCSSVRSTNQLPSGNSRRTSVATRAANRVLPTPPIPVKVTSRERDRSRLTSRPSRRRPTKLLRSPGTLPAVRRRIPRSGADASLIEVGTAPIMRRTAPTTRDVIPSGDRPEGDSGTETVARRSFVAGNDPEGRRRCDRDLTKPCFLNRSRRCTPDEAFRDDGGVELVEIERFRPCRGVPPWRTPRPTVAPRRATTEDRSYGRR